MSTYAHETYDLVLPDGSTTEVQGNDFDVEVDGLGVVVAHANQAASRLIEWFKKPVYTAIARAVGDELQEAENALWEVLLSRYIDNAAGEALVFLGERVGEPPGNLSDPDYRVRIRARVLINRSRGGPEDLLAIVRALGEHAHVRNTGNASVRLDLTAEPENAATSAQIADLLGEAVSAGVRLHVVAPVSANPFMLGSVSDGALGSMLDSASGGVDEPGELAHSRMV